MKSILTLAICCLTLFSSKAHADCCDSGVFLSVASGCSWTMNADISVDTAFWDASPEGYNDDLGSSEFYTLGIGYHFCNNFSTMFEATYRPNFRYERFQTSTAVTAPGFIGIKTRYFRLSSLDFLFDLYWNKQGTSFSYNVGNLFCIAPYLGAGVGVAYNRMWDFHSFTPPTAGAAVPNENGARSIMNDWTETSVAAQGIVGLVSNLTCNLSLDIAYRFFYGGNIRSNDYAAVNTGIVFNGYFQVPAWEGNLKANEIVIGLNYKL